MSIPSNVNILVRSTLPDYGQKFVVSLQQKDFIIFTDSDNELAHQIRREKDGIGHIWVFENSILFTASEFVLLI